MPKIATFRIRKFVDGKSTFYGIWIPAYLSVTGKAAYRYYTTKADAERARGDLLSSTRTESKVTELSNAEIRDAQRALERLAEAGLDLSLCRAIELAIPALKAAGLSMTTDKLITGFAQLKHESWSEKSRSNFAFAARHFLAEFGGRPLISITTAELQTWLDTRWESPAYRANILRTLRPAFSYAARQEYIPSSPFSRLETIRLKSKDSIDIFTPAEARRLLKCAAAAGADTAFSLLLFAGIRPQELTRLVWGDIKDGFIHIRPGVAKTAQVRNIDIEPTLEPYLAHRGYDSEKIIPSNWKRKSQQVRAAAGLSGRQDAARHSYASYYLAKYRDEDALKMNMGHSRTSSTLFAHYRAAATPAQAAAYWAITT